MRALLFLSPFIAWIIAGCIKFAVNCLRSKRCATNLIGYGGWPSNHSCIVATIVTLAGFLDGLYSAVFIVSLGFGFLFILDALSLRRQIGCHAKKINNLSSDEPLRERVGHSPFEVISGMVLGIIVGCGIWFLVR
jgi:uncharacterized protein